jgi:hypothetical protein
MNIEIKTEKCLLCGKKLGVSGKVRGHLIPKCLKPKINIIGFFHMSCEKTINSLYVSQQKSDRTKRIKNVLEDTIVKLTSALDRVNELEEERLNKESK